MSTLQTQASTTIGGIIEPLTTIVRNEGEHNALHEHQQDDKNISVTGEFEIVNHERLVGSRLAVAGPDLIYQLIVDSDQRQAVQAVFVRLPTTYDDTVR